MRIIFALNKIIAKEKQFKIVIAIFFGLYVFSLPMFSGRDKYNLVSYAIMALLSAFVLLYILLFRKTHLRSFLFVLPLFVIFAFIGTFLFSKNYRSWLTLLLLSITFFVFYYSLIIISDIRLVLYIIVFAFIVFSVIFLFHYRSDIFRIISNKGISSGSERIGEDFDNVNQIGSYMSSSLLLSMFLGINFKKKKELFILLASPLFVSVGLLTGSRTFIISAAIGILTLTIIKLRKRWVLLIVVLACVIALFFVFINLPFMSFLRNQFQNMIFTLFGINGGYAKADVSTLERVLWQEYALYLGSKNIVFGYGASGFSIFSGLGTYSHGNFAEMLCNFGIVGVSLFYSMFFFPLFFLQKSKDNEKYLIVLLFVHYLINSFLSIFYYDKDLYVLFAIMFYLVKDTSLHKQSASTNIFNEVVINI